MGPFRFSILQAGVFAALMAGVLWFAPSAHGQFRDPDILIDLDQFGFGSIYRPGEIVPMRLRLTNNPAGRLDQAVEVWVQWEVPNSDGDIVGYGRPVTLTRGAPLPVWLYAPVPPTTRDADVWAIRIFEWRDGQRRAEIGGRRVRPADFGSRAVPVATNLIGVLGQRKMGLAGYESSDQDRLPSAYEHTYATLGIRPDTLPDRWYPLIAYEAIVWAAGSPQELTSDSARALIDYVRWGGHLVIVLPEDGDPWQFSARGRTLLDDVLPRRDPRLDEGLEVRDLVPVLSKARGLHPTSEGVRPINIRVFREVRGTFNAIEPPYEPLLALGDGRVFAVQRLLGFGRITIVGLDIAQGRLTVRLSNGAMGIPEADVFWNRILGRRMDTPSPAALEALRAAERQLLVTSRTATVTPVGSGQVVLSRISIGGMEAGLVLMLALLLFAVYWILAGPGGFALLRMYKKSHHSWMAFAGAAGVFTAVAWGIVGAVRSGARMNEPQIEHLTYLDHIVRTDGTTREEDPQQQRAISWFSLFTPGYARTHVSIEHDSNERNVLFPWTPHEGLHRFPNADRYMVNVAHSPGGFEIPSRSTATLLAARWMGGLDPDWGGMIRADINDPVRVVRDAGGGEQGLAGRLTHGFSGPLEDVSVIWVRNLRLPPRRYAVSDDVEHLWVPPLMSGMGLNSTYMWRLGQGGRWHPGQVLDLAASEFAPLGAAMLDANLRGRYVDEYRSPLLTTARMAEADIQRYLEMLNFFHQLPPPSYIKTRRDDRDPDNPNFQRQLGRELDLSPWFNRPCLIVIGFLKGSETPVPVYLGGENGRQPVSKGTTVVRWIHPLPVIDEIALRPFGVEGRDNPAGETDE